MTFNNLRREVSHTEGSSQGGLNAVEIRAKSVGLHKKGKEKRFKLLGMRELRRGGSYHF